LIVEAVRDGGMERVVRNAATAGIGVVLIHGEGSWIDDIRREHPGVPLAWVTADNRAIGHLQGRQFRALRPQGGLVLYATGPMTSGTAEQRLEGAREALQGANIDLSVVSGNDWTPTTGERIVLDWLKLVVPGVVLPTLVGCQCDDIALAARRTLRDAAQALGHPALAHVPVTGVDGVPSFGQRLVSEGELAATVIMPVATGPAIELAVHAVQEHRYPPAKQVLPPVSFPEISALRPVSA
jgi:ABC-type sugar transport system substrate-binding protein